MKDELGPKIISLKDYKNKKYVGELWEYPDCYEYCLIPSYEDKYKETHTDCIQLGDCFANIIRSRHHYVLISIIFEKEREVQDIIDWLDTHEITIFPPMSTPLELKNTNSIVEAIKFKGCPLVLSERGYKTKGLDPLDMEDVSELYEAYDKITNTGLAKPVEDIEIITKETTTIHMDVLVKKEMSHNTKGAGD